MFGTILAWIRGISPSVWKILKPLAKSAAMAVLAEIQDMVAKRVQEASAKTDLDGKQKFDYVKNNLKADLKDAGKEVSEHALNFAIETTLATIKEKTVK